MGKTVFYRSVIEIALILFLIYLLLNLKAFKHLNFIKNPLIISLALFFISLVVSVVLADNSYRAFWGDLERGEGLFGMLHALVFMFIATIIFEKKDWLNYFKISLIVGFIVIFYAILQYFGIRNFPFALIPEARPISYIGNAAFLATHMFFLMMFAAVVFFKTYKPINFKFKLSYWRHFSLLIIILSALTVFITGTRGAILGLGAGIFALLAYFSIYGRRKSVRITASIKLNLQKLAIGLILMMFIFSGAFWFTRDNQVWQKVPGLNRLAKTAAFDINDASTQFRLMTWKLSWKAFKEKPFFGWGPENYIIAYEKYYDPDYALYGESWLDRAHNKVIDVVVMQGIFGLVVYLGIFGAVFYLLFRKTNEIRDKDGGNAAAGGVNFLPLFIAAGLIGYFVQNLSFLTKLFLMAPFRYFRIYNFKYVDKFRQRADLCG